MRPSRLAALLFLLTAGVLAQDADSTLSADTVRPVPPAATDSAAPRRGGWGDFFLATTMSGYRSSDSGNATSGSLGFDLSRSFRWKILSITPSLSVESQDDLPHTSVVNSVTASLAASVSPLSWLGFSGRCYRLFQEEEDDYGAYLRVGLSTTLPADLSVSASAGLSDNHLGRPAPSAGVGLSQDLDVFDWSLGGSWSRTSQSYSNTRIRTTIKQPRIGSLVTDTTTSDTSEYVSQWGANASMNLSGDEWSTGPSACVSWSTIPLGTNVIAIQGAAGKSSSKSSATALNTSLELAWNASWSPSNWLDLSTSISNTWGWQQLKVANKGRTPASPQQSKQLAKELGSETPPPAGLGITLEADVSF